MNPKEVFAVLALSLGLFVVAAFSAREEGAPFLLRTAPLQSRLAAAVADGKDRQPVSWLASRVARTVQLETCLTTLKELIRISPPRAPLIADVDRGCLKIGESIAAEAPASSNAWFLAATEAARLGDNERMKRYLMVSYRTGPTEEWIAERRGLFGYRIADHLDADLRASIDGDLALMLRTNSGVQLLAERYVSDPDIRQHLADIAAKLDARTQHDFYEYVKGAVYEKRDK
jgi:hypothetical protein